VAVVDVIESDQAGYAARRVRPASSGGESWTVIGPDYRPVGVVDEFLGWLTCIERSPNTVEAYARDLRVFCTFLAVRGLSWDAVTGGELGEFAAWARQPAENVVVISEQATGRCARTVNRMLTTIVDFYEFHARRSNRRAGELVVRTRGGAGTTSRSCTESRAPSRGGGRCVCVSSNGDRGR
jgi:hypothetical protein